MEIINKNEKVFVQGDDSVGMPSYEGFIIEKTKENTFSIKDKFGQIEELKRDQFKTIKEIEEEQIYSEEQANKTFI